MESSSYSVLNSEHERIMKAAMAEATITDTSVMVASSEQVSCDLAGETAILNLKNGTYYGLDAVGTRIWVLLQQPRTVAEIRDSIVSEFDVTAERCQADLVELLHSLLEAQLVEVRPA